MKLSDIAAASAGGKFSPISSNITLVDGGWYSVNTTVARTLTLPALSGVTAGKTIRITDASFLAATNNVSLVAAGSDTITKNAVSGASLTLNENGFDVWIVASSTTWRVVDSAGGEEIFNSLATNATLTPGQWYLVNTTAARTLTLPAASTATPGQNIRVVDANGSAATNNITVNRTGTDTITVNGSTVTSFVINDNGADAWFNAISGGWQLVQGEPRNVNLDAIAGLSTSANTLDYWTGAGTAALTNLTAFGRTYIGSNLSWSSGTQIPALTASSTVSLLTVGSSSGNILDKASGDALYMSFTAPATLTGGIYNLSNATSNQFIFSANGVNPPSYTTRSSGTKLVLYPQLSVSNVDYAIGIDGSTLWLSVPSSSQTFKFYAGTSVVSSISGSGVITGAGLALTNGTQTASSPVISATQTWSNSAVTFTGVLLNVTDTNSAGASLLLDLQVAGSSKFNVDKAGNALAAGAVRANTLADTQGFAKLVFTPGAGGSLNFNANTVELRNGTNSQTFNLYGTYTDASNYSRANFNTTTAGALWLTTQAAGTGTSSDIVLFPTGAGTAYMFSQAGLKFSNDNALDIGASGANRPRSVFFGTNLTGGGSNQILFGSNARIGDTAAGNLMLSTTGSGTGFGLLQLGGTTSSFPAIKRNTTSIDLRLADDSGYSGLNTGALNVYSATNVFGTGITGQDIILNIGSGTGPGIGYATGFKFNRQTDGAGILVTEVASDATLYEFWMSDNPDGGDFFSWRWSDWQGQNGLWVPLWLTGLSNRYHASSHQFYGGFSQQTSSYYTTGDPLNTVAASRNITGFSTASKLKTNTLAGTVDIVSLNISGFTGSDGQVIWIKLSGSTTFDWGIGSPSGTATQTGLTISSSGVTLSNGIIVTFSGNSGGISGDTFQFRAWKAALNVLAQSQFNGNLYLSGTTSAFPMLKRNATALDLRLADDSAYAPINTALLTSTVSGSGNFYQALFQNGANAAGATAGFRLATASGWEIRFRTNQSNGWFEITDSGNNVYHRWMSNDYLMANTGVLGWSSEGNFATSGTGARDTALLREAAGILSQRNGTTGQVHRVYSTYTDAANYTRLSVDAVNSRIGLEGAGTGLVSTNLYLGAIGSGSLVSQANLIFQTDNTYDIGATGANRARNLYLAGSVNAAGAVNSGSSLALAGASFVGWGSRSTIWAPVDGNILLQNNASTSFGLLQLGGTTSSFPALKRNGAQIDVRLADDSGPAILTAANLQQFVELRALPTTVNDCVDIGSFFLTNGAHSVRMGLTVASSGFSISKLYDIPVQFFTDTGWLIVESIASTGPYSGHDFQLEGRVTTNTMFFRIRRTSGTIAANIQAQIQSSGFSTDAWTASSGTTAAAPALTAYFPGTGISQVANAVTYRANNMFHGGATALFTTDNTYDIGAVGANRPKNIYAAATIAGNYLGSATAVEAAAGNVIGMSGRSRIGSSADSNLTLYNNALSGFTLLQFGGTTSSFPAWKRSGSDFQARVADDTAYAMVSALGLASLGTGRPGLSVNSLGVNFGQVQNIDAHTWGLGFGTTTNTNGTTVLNWTDNAGITSSVPVTIANGTVTANNPVLNITQTWSNASVIFQAAVINVTATANNASSTLLDLQNTGTSKFRVFPDGAFTSNGGTSTIVGNLRLTTDASIFSLGSANDVNLARDGANTLAQRNGATTQRLNIYGTYTDSSNYERGSLIASTTAFSIGADSSGTGSVRPLQFYVSGTNIFQINTSGHLSWNADNTYDIGINGTNRPRNLYIGGSQTVGAGAVIQSSGRWMIGGSTSDGVLYMTNAGGTDFGRLQFGGTTASFPSLKRSTTSLQVRLADDSAYGGFAADVIAANQHTSLGSTYTASTPMLSLSQTWSNASVAFTGAVINVTDTASAVGSLLLDLQVATVSKFSVRKDGNITAVTYNGYVPTSQTATFLGATGSIAYDSATNTAALWSALPVGYSRMFSSATGTAGGAPLSNFGYFTKVANRDTLGGWGGLWVGYAAGQNYIGRSPDNATLPTWEKLWTDGGTNLFGADNTYDIGASGTNRPRSIYIGTQAAIGNTAAINGATLDATVPLVVQGNSTSFEGIRVHRQGTVGQYLAIDETDGSQHRIRAVGAKPFYIINQDATVGAIGIEFDVNGASAGQGGTRSLILLNNGLLALQGTTSSFPAIKRNAAGIDFRLADDSAYASIRATDFTTAGGSTFSNTGVIFSANGRIAPQSDGVFLLSNNATTDFGRLQFGGTTSSFPAIRRNGAGLSVRLADDSAPADLTAGNLTGASGTRQPNIANYTLEIHPEAASPTVLPFISNDLAYLRLRGGSVTTNYPGGLGNASTDPWFDGSPSYGAITPSAMSGTPLVITINFPSTLLWGTKYGISFGNPGWRAQSVKIEIFMLSSSTWTTIYNVTGQPDATIQVPGSFGDGTGVNAMRVTLDNFASSTDGRIAQIWALNYNSTLSKMVFLPRDGGAMYGNITFGTDNAYDIGANGANRPRNVYAANSLTSGGNINVGSNSRVVFGGHSLITDPGTDGNLMLSNNAANSFGLLQFGGTTSSFPALKVSGTSLWVRLADDSAYTNIRANYFAMNSGSRITDSADGTLIVRNSGTTSAKLAFVDSTSSYPMLKQNGTGLDVRLGDDSAYTTLTVSQITLGADPTSAMQAATKQYVDNALSGLDAKQSVRAASTANVSISTPGTLTIDGVSLSTGNRILLKNQSTQSENGIYVYNGSGSALTRATDMDAWTEFPAAYVFIEEGTTLANTGWVCTVTQSGTLGTTSVGWVQFNGNGGTSYTAGTGLFLSGNQFSLTGQALAFHNLATTGLVTLTGSGTVTGRTIGTSGSGIVITNGDGVSGAPSIALSTGMSNLAALSWSSGIQIPSLTAANTWALKTVGSSSGNILDKAAGDALYLSLGGGTLTGALTLNADPSTSLQAATKQYVDTAINNVDAKQSVRAASTATVTITAPGTSIDGVTLSNGDRVLLKDQSTASQNGIYQFNGSAVSMTRVSDMTAWSQLPGAHVYVEEGTTNAVSGWLCTVAQGGTLGTTSITFSQLGAVTQKKLDEVELLAMMIGE